jgi:nucleoid DNA-binding protein
VGFGTFKLTHRTARKGRNPQSTFALFECVHVKKVSRMIYVYIIVSHLPPSQIVAGEEIDIAASNSPSFSASKTFKEKCNPER